MVAAYRVGHTEPMTTPTPEMLQLLRTIGDNVGRAVRPTSLDSELTRAVTAIRQLYDAAACSVALLEPDGTELRFRAADGVGAQAIVGMTLGLGRGIAGWVAMTAQAIEVNDVQRDPRFARHVAEATDYVPHHLVAVPLIDTVGVVIGVLEVLDPAGDGDSGQSGPSLDVLGLIAAQVATAVRLCQLYDAMGLTLISALGQADDPESLGRALAELGQEEGADELARLADAFRQLAHHGPDARRLAHRLLHEVLTFVQGRR